MEWEKKYGKKITLEESKFTNEDFFKIYSACYKREKEKEFMMKNYISAHNIELWSKYLHLFNTLELIPIDSNIGERRIILAHEFFSNEKNQKSDDLNKNTLHQKYEFLKEKIENTGMVLNSLSKLMEDHWNFIITNGNEELVKYLQWEEKNELLDMLEDELSDNFGPDSENLIGLIGYQLYKLEN